MTYPPIPPAPELNWDDLAAIPISENHVPLKMLEPGNRLRIRPFYFENGISGAINNIYLREEALNRLETALSLLPEAYGIEVLDGWRPVAVQEALRNDFYRKIVSRHPEYSEAEIATVLDQFVANPHNHTMPPPHSTGGSVDLTLFDMQTGQALDMGTAFDEPSRRSHTAALEETDLPAKNYRRLLVHIMRQAGFSNIPTEWWHFDYGNQNWAFYTRQPYAVYGMIQKP
ncbi:M15 family metallopeptidase [Neisseria animalis]|uniref:D-alanyl-D-alanine dipeptidase n=1 Tax=Neisseria animalis TaxID=492 RepID=A0A5P3MSK0_NEIAN|nr:M15 family metallopeptidase [Neisseria animalis]QEY24554.1 D-alanyl-D-alanine dipeptidase [Neisseria animalis]ROW33030.1 D-alanyl-D-alanine dipeptidase [Neisseria animalis]VEE07349.1 putative D-alanyl-d-alanine dipeptidase [Neisseria animalis]